MTEFLSDGAELFATSCVRDFAAARAWYEAFLGVEPSFLATPTEAVWEVAPHRWIVVEQRSDRAGGATHTLYVADFEERISAIANRGIEPDRTETYGEGVRKMIFLDPEGNEVCLGGNA